MKVVIEIPKGEYTHIWSCVIDNNGKQIMYKAFHYSDGWFGRSFESAIKAGKSWAQGKIDTLEAEDLSAPEVISK